MMTFKSLFSMAAAALVGTSMALAQSYPNKPIRILVGYAPGGSADAGIRPLAKALEPLLGQPLVIDYKPGNAGGVAMEMIAKAPADGYTLYYFDSGPLTVAPHMGKVTYDVNKSFTVLSHVCGSGSMLVAHPGTPFKTLSDVVTASKREPDKWSYGTSGVAGPHHLSGEYFKSVSGAVLLHVPYKGGGPAMADLMGGQVPMLFSSLGPVVSAAKAGKVRPLAVGSPKRSPLFPEVPTLDEAGLKGFDADTVFGFYAPAGTPAAVIERLNREINKVLDTPEVRARIAAIGGEYTPNSVEQFNGFLKTELPRWAQVIQDTGVKVD